MQCIAKVTVYPNDEPIQVPCGKCIPCVMTKRDEWITRLMVEHRFSKGGLFVTLTYDPEHLPEDGKLVKRDFQLFMKRLRKSANGALLRYYAVGEYGSRYGRPHYHMLLFSSALLDERVIRSSWGLGSVHIGKMTAASIAYTTKYMIQPKREGQFALMSRAYGIGGKYLTDAMCAWHHEAERTYVLREGEKHRLPRFYKDKIFYDKDQRDRIGRRMHAESMKAEEKLVADLKEQGYNNPGEIIREMRQRLFERVKVKVQYSQKF